MRTTVEIPDSLFRRAKSQAAREGVSLKTLLVRAVENELAREGTPAARRIKFPLLKSKEPRTLDLTNAEIDELLA